MSERAALLDAVIAAAKVWYWSREPNGDGYTRRLAEAVRALDDYDRAQLRALQESLAEVHS